MVRETLSDRREKIYSSFKPVEGEFSFATAIDGQELDTIQSFLEESIKASCEGLMVKMLDTLASYYEPSKRSRNWLKVKKDYLAGAGDSLDLVVIGGYHGKGKRTSVYGAFLLACYNPPPRITRQSATSARDSRRKCSPSCMPSSWNSRSRNRSHTMRTPQGTCSSPMSGSSRGEVKTADLSLSPKYMAAKGLADTEGKGRGVSLRLPRFIRERDDKKPDDATSTQQVAEMYKKQDVVMNNAKKGVDDDFEY